MLPFEQAADFPTEGFPANIWFQWIWQDYARSSLHFYPVLMIRALILYYVLF